MPRYQVEFRRTVIEYHRGEVEADSLEAAQQAYDDGEVATKVVDSAIIDEQGDELTELKEAAL